ncbi:MAG: methyltransferase [Myxococcales bacterium]|nr:methyltransferase [Myxococcales bacterium]
MPALETQLLLDHPELWSGPKVVLGPPGADVAQLGEGTFWIPDAHERASAARGDHVVVIGGVTLDAPAPTAIVYLPKGNARRDLALALAAANAQRLVLVGHVKAGIKSAKKGLGGLGRVTRVEHGRHCQLFVAEVSPTVKSATMGSATMGSATMGSATMGSATIVSATDGTADGPGTTSSATDRATGGHAAAAGFALRERRFTLDAEGLTLVSLPGVFAEGRLDDATALLLAHLELPSTGRLLDLGCGAGPLGLAAKRRASGLEVWLADADDFAVEAARRGAAANGLDVEVRSSDLYEALPGRFDVIVSNPPFHHGVGTEYEVTRRLIREAPAHLHPRGELWLVANAFLPWAETLDEVFAEVTTIAETRRFRVVRARRPR